MTDPEAREPGSPGGLGWGILATGGIARAMTRDLLLHRHRVVAVGSRSRAAATAFADDFNILRSYGSYDALVADPDVDVVYVATPHSFHAENALAAIEAGKHVLVEKAFTLNAQQARAVFAAARSRGTVVMEAMWTRFLPHMAYVRSVLAGGELGELRSVHADHTQKLPTDPVHRLNNPELAGGALLDLGVYPLSFAHDILGAPITTMARGRLRDTGVDVSVATISEHANGALSTTYTSMVTRGQNTATVLCTEGRIDLDAVWYSPTTVTVRNSGNEVLDRFDQPVSGRGMHFQAAELERMVADGDHDSPLMSAAETIGVMETMDEIRASLGVFYPGE